MKNTLIIIFLMIFSVTFAQDEIKKQLGSFNEIKLFSGLKVELKKSEESHIVITGKMREEVVIKNVNGRLKLSIKIPKTFDSDDVKVTIFTNENLTLIDVNEGAYLKSDDLISQHRIELKAQEGAAIHVNLEVKLLVVKSVTGGIVELRGTTDNQTIDVNTGGIYKSLNLVSKQAEVNAASGAIANVLVTDVLDAKVNLGGNIYYKGEPKEIITKKILGGTIKSID